MYLSFQDGILQPQKQCVDACMYAGMSAYGGIRGGEGCLWGSLFALGKASALNRTRRLRLAPGRALPSLPLLPGNIISDAAHVHGTLITTFWLALYVVIYTFSFRNKKHS